MNKIIKLNFDFNTVVEEFRNSIMNTTILPNRQKLTVLTDNYFSKILQETGQVKCLLRSRGVGTKKTDSRKTHSPIFNGKFHCLDKNCHIKFQITLFKPNDKFITVQISDSECKHALLKEKEKFTGEKRKEISFKLSTYGVSKCIDKKINIGNFRNF